MKRCISRMLALFVLASTISSALANAQTGTDSAGADKSSQKRDANAFKWKQQILKVPVGSYMKVKLHSHDEVEGQLREISDSGFSMQTLKDHKIETVAIAYEDLKSLSVAGQSGKGEKAAKSIGKGILGGLIP